MVCIFDHLRGFRHFDRTGPIGSALQNNAVKRINDLCGFRSRTGSNLRNIRQSMLFIPGIDPFRAVSAEKVDIEFQPGKLFQYRHTLLFGTARIYRALIDDDRSRLHHAAHSFVRQMQQRQIRTVVLIHRRRHGHDKNVPVFQIDRVAGVFQADRGFQVLR